MKLGDTIFNGNQFKNVILNSVSFKRLILGVNLVWSYFSIAIKTFKTRILADGGTYESESILEDRLQEITPNLFDSASLVITPNGVKTSKLYSIKPSDGTGDLIVTRNTSATRIDENGNIVNVPANMARIDYTTGSPAILVEPQRTNLITQGNTLSDWTINNLIMESVSTDNPFGLNTVTRFTENDINGVHQAYARHEINPKSVISFSFYVKSAGIDSFNFGGNWDFFTSFNLTTGVFSGSSASKYRSINMGNGWWRVIFTDLVPDTSYRSYVIRLSSSGARKGLGIFVYGAQLEVGENATSYIPTTTSSVTRNADAISKTGISSLMGQTEGTIYFETNKLFVDSLCGYVNISESAQNRILIYGSTPNDQLVIQVRINNITKAHSTFFTGMSSNAKVAFGYKNGDSALYINGVKYSTALDTINYNFPVTLSKLDVMNYDGSSFSNGNIKLCSLFKTRLTNTQLQQLTTL